MHLEANMSDTALEMDHVSKKFKKGEIHDSLRDLIPFLTKNVFRRDSDNVLGKREFWALNDISFQVKCGEAFGIIGRNGAGKSTILKILSGIMKPTKGKMNVHGKLSSLIEIGAGFHPDLTGYENIFLKGTILGMNRKEIKEKVSDIVEFSELSEFIDTPVKRYSSGMYARLGFSVAAHVEPDVLIVDEVLSVGDMGFQQKCMDKMKSLSNGGTTVIFVSHNIKAISSLCGNSILLEQGRITESGPTGKVINSFMGKFLFSGEVRDGKNVYIPKIIVRNQDKERSNFEAGEKVLVDVVLSSNIDIDRVAVAISIRDNQYDRFFYVRSDFLGCKPFPMKSQETKVVTFELMLHLTAGSYYLLAMVVDPDNEQMMDSRSVTIFVDSGTLSKGVINLYPKVVMNERSPQETDTSKGLHTESQPQ
jgi:lipopolysaccharide transport system ATP-binding protein